MSNQINESTPAQQGDSVDLKLEYIRNLVNQVMTAVKPLQELSNLSEEVQNDIQQQLTGFALSLKTAKLRREELDSFFKKPYVTLPVPGKRDSWYLIMPRFIDMQIGWLDKQTESFNVFLVNRYTELLGEIPDEIKRQLGMKPAPPITLRGNLLVGPQRDLDEAAVKYKQFLKGRTAEGLVIDKSNAFNLIATLYKDGIRPIEPKPMDPGDVVERPLNFEPRDYQLAAWEKLRQYSHVGVFIPPNVGKTFIALLAMSRIKGPHLVAVPSQILREQWVERIQLYTDLKPEEYTVATYQSAIGKHADRKYTLKVFDEVQHLPANSFIKFSRIDAKYSLGLSATPQREDGREEYIFALTGYATGLNWDHFKKLGLIKSPTLHVWILKNFEAKLAKIRTLLAEEKKTLIFSDSLEVGETIAARFKAPFVNGESKERLNTIKDNVVTVISRVGDEGISLPDLERVIEVNWLGGSRRQELQRFTRLLHGRTDEQGEGHLLMLVEEYQRDRKRLFSVMDKGFKVSLHYEAGTEESINKRIEGPAKPRQRRQGRIEQPVKPIEASAINGVLGLPGVQRIMGSLSGPQKRVYELLIKNDGQWFKRSSLTLLLGYVSENSLRTTVDFSGMVTRGLIEQRKTKEGLEYRTNITSKTGGSS